ncbi:hypothetical protein AAG570_011179 [Ranatra chinensis]|uniref:tRNA (adenine(58)-N(1))-methyltransferase non-catalytic subunit TRM6 n=1 Tax=Ranatra chinensis TaxID=642074 RepID=A0ABD0YW29_9HEMI
MEGSAKEVGELIAVGHYIVIQRGSYFRVHQLSDGFIILGKDKVDLKSVIGQPYWTTFKMVPKEGRKKEFDLEKCDRVESLLVTLMKDVKSGSDNRDITDDGSSQLLSTEEIIELRDSGLSPQDVLGKLIENSKTFKNKTEYSQEKYVKKKEKKYYEYLTIRKPTMRLLAKIFYDRDQTKVMGLRYDTLSQIITASNIQCDGTYILFESGTQALVGAAILNQLGESGHLINITLGNQAQKQAILGMNFNKQRLDSLLSNPANKRPRWADELEKAYGFLSSVKADGLIIASKEFAFDLICKLIPFIKPSRPLVIYSLYREPLVQHYMDLKKRKDIVALHLTETWLRTYQILPDRTHPDVVMSSTGGHLLTGIIIQP